MKTRSAPKRGILLLVVLSLLSLFVLAGITFIVVAGQYRRGSISGTKVERTGERPDRIADEALFQLLNPPTSGSALSGHGLLADLYGTDSATNSVSAATLEMDDQLIYITPASPLSGLAYPANVHGYFGGGILTMTEGDAEGLSTRILSYDVTNNQIIIENFTDYVGTTNVISAINGQAFMINGRAFNGFGAGYDGMAVGLGHTVSIQLETGSADVPTALIPNIARAIDSGKLNPDFVALNADALAIKDMDEPWDAADYQNIFLGWIPQPNPAGEELIPSFHRPWLVNHFLSGSWGLGPLDAASAQANIELWRHLILRPLKIDHPEFTGGNLNGDNPDPGAFPLGFDPVNGPWDVDNDGDGIPDSVWIDIGMPAFTNDDGRSVRPLVAMLCIDMDSRLNVNAHGSLTHTLPSYSTGVNITPLATADPSSTAHLGGAGSAMNVGRGRGYGVADISLAPLMTTDHTTLLKGRYYGADTIGEPGIAMVADDELIQLTFSSDMNGDGQTDAPIPLQTLGDPFDYATEYSSYSSPPDFDGDGLLFLNPAGQPYTFNMGEVSESLDDPYELNLNRPIGFDSRYTESELEPLLRWYDFDRPSLPGRLANLTTLNGHTLDDHARRRALTTRSFEVPSLPQTLDELLSAVPATLPPWNGLTAAQRAVMFPFEFLRGEPMNLNRPFGDGIDNIDYGVVPPEGNDVADEPGEESDFDELLRQNIFADNQPLPLPDSNLAPVRQLYARHLYCLMMMLRSANLDIDENGVVDTDNETAHRLAQWAINVVDFVDSDSIMTPFEFDLVPSNGWDVDGDLGTTAESDRAIVWGCERPELIISETAAFHDIRTEDLGNDDGDMATTSDATPDNDFDQRLLPVGSAFVELMNPWMGSADKQQGELYFTDASGNRGVRLGDRRRVFWRLLVVNDIRTVAEQNANPLDWDALQDNQLTLPGAVTDSEVSVERIVYFADPTRAAPGPALPNGGRVDIRTGLFEATTPPEVYFRSGAIAPILPGRYVVIGSAGSDTAIHNVGTSAATTLGLRTGSAVSDLISSTRRIVLSPANDPNVNQVDVYNDGDFMTASESDALLMSPVAMQPAVAIVINRGGRFNVSEPLGGYPTSAADGFDVSIEAPLGGYTTPRDEPIDWTAGIWPFEAGQAPPLAKTTDALRNEGRTPGFRTVLLQRLADPTRQWDAVTNPYRTIDSMPVDLFVFNGVTPATDPASLLGTIQPASFERGAGLPEGAPSDDVQMLWRYPKIPPLTAAVPVTTPTHVFPYEFEQTLGRLNDSFGTPISNADGKDLRYVGMPTPPGTGELFPWLTWNNRPFISKYELLNVPRTRSSRLFIDFDIRTAPMSIQLGWERNGSSSICCPS